MMSALNYMNYMNYTVTLIKYKIKPASFMKT